jgi:hypothetical protein
VSFSMAWGLRPQAGCCRPCRGSEGEGAAGSRGWHPGLHECRPSRGSGGGAPDTSWVTTR